MQLSFVPRELSALDDLDVELLVVGAWSDIRPVRGAAGLCDWRLGGRLSHLMREGFITGARDEVVLIPGKPRLTFDKVLIFGLGVRADFDVASYESVVRTILHKLEKLRVRTAAVELPGRHEGLIDAGEAASILLDAAESSPDCDGWILIENAEGRVSMEVQAQERRRRRRVFG